MSDAAPFVVESTCILDAVSEKLQYQNPDAAITSTTLTLSVESGGHAFPILRCLPAGTTIRSPRHLECPRTSSNVKRRVTMGIQVLAVLQEVNPNGTCNGQKYSWHHRATGCEKKNLTSQLEMMSWLVLPEIYVSKYPQIH